MLEFRRRNITELPFEVLEQAHWRPQEAQLCCKHKSKANGVPEYRRLRKYWRGTEVNFNFSLDALLMCLTPDELGELARSISELDFDATHLIDGYCAQLKRIIGVPDWVLSDSENCLLGENKLSANFSLDQFIKYQTYAQLLRADPSLPNSTSIVIVVRDTDPSKFISDIGRRWNPVVADSRLHLSPTDDESMCESVRENIELLSEMFTNQASLLSNELAVALRAIEIRLVPTIAISWDQFAERFLRKTKRPDLESAIERLLEIATGSFQIQHNC